MKIIRIKVQTQDLLFNLIINTNLDYLFLTWAINSISAPSNLTLCRKQNANYFSSDQPCYNFPIWLCFFCHVKLYWKRDEKHFYISSFFQLFEYESAWKALLELQNILMRWDSNLTKFLTKNTKIITVWLVTKSLVPVAQL